MKKEYGEVEEKLDRDKLKDFQAANAQYAKDLADLARKWGKEVAEAALK